jgi:hypothetical protein
VTNPQTANADLILPLVYMRFRPAWAYIDGVREFGRFFCLTTFKESDVAERARVVIQEALENAVKYSTPGPESELELSISSQGAHIEISVTSVPDPEHIGSLKAELDRINATDPAQAYLAAIERAAESPDASARLGLARIRFEGNVELSIRELEGGRVRVTASGSL